MSKQILLPPSRRSTSRINTPEGVWVFWRCNERDDTSRVGNLSLGGLFVETGKPKPVGSTVKLDFLVQEGQIRAEAIVQRADPGRGLGLKFTAINDGDRSRMAALMNRIHGLNRDRPTRSAGGLQGNSLAPE